MQGTRNTGSNGGANVPLPARDYAAEAAAQQAAIAAQQAQQARQQRLNEAYNANEQGNALLKKGDWAKAIHLYEEAARKSPNDKIIRDNLAKAQRRLQAQRAEAEQERLAKQRDKTAASNMQRDINIFAETLNAAPASSGGLDFDGGNSGTPPSGGGGLDFISPIPPANADKPAAASEVGNPMVVNAQNVRSGLPPEVDTAIAGVFSSAPPGVANAVSKGFQAVVTHDWKVAAAWFGDALNRDPGNTTLKNLLTAAHSKPASSKGDAIVDRYRKGYDAVIAGDRPGAISAFEAAMRNDPSHGGSIGTYVDYLRAKPKSAATQVLQLPTESDMEFMFDDLREKTPATKPTPANRPKSQKDVQSDADWLNEPEPGHAWKQFFRMLTPVRKIDQNAPVINSGFRG